jgi:hypothetical protein
MLSVLGLVTYLCDYYTKKPVKPTYAGKWAVRLSRSALIPEFVSESSYSYSLCDGGLREPSRR